MIKYLGGRLRPKGLRNAKDVQGQKARGRHKRRRTLEQRYAHVHERRIYQMIIAHTPEAALHVGADARLLYASDYMCQRLGFTREELLRMHIYDIDPDYPKQLWPQHWDELRSERSRIFETKHQTKNGKLIPVEVSLRFFELDGIEYIVSLVRDISDRRQAEEELKRRQSQIIALSAPVLRIANGIVTLPVIGELNAGRASQILEKLLGEIVATRARYAILDLTGVSRVDADTASQLATIGRAVRLLGSRCLLSGISPQTAQTLYATGIDTESFNAFGTLQDALFFALASRR